MTIVLVGTWIQKVQFDEVLLSSSPDEASIIIILSIIDTRPAIFGERPVDYT